MTLLILSVLKLHWIGFWVSCSPPWPIKCALMQCSGHLFSYCVGYVNKDICLLKLSLLQTRTEPFNHCDAVKS